MLSVCLSVCLSVSVRPSVTLCIVERYRPTYYTATVSEQVNRKCPPLGIRRYNFQPPTSTYPLKLTARLLHHRVDAIWRIS